MRIIHMLALLTRELSILRRSSMLPAEVREIVRLTVDEILDRKVFKVDSYQYMLGVVGGRLINFFSDKDNSAAHALRELSYDPYIDIIYLQYRDGKTLEWIAEYMDREVSTIKRNKKRLITKLYELLEVE